MTKAVFKHAAQETMSRIITAKTSCTVKKNFYYFELLLLNEHYRPTIYKRSTVFAQGL